MVRWNILKKISMTSDSWKTIGQNYSEVVDQSDILNANDTIWLIREVLKSLPDP